MWGSQVIRGFPPHSAVGKVDCKFESQIQIQGNSKWLGQEDVSDEAGSIWGEYILDLTARDDIERVRLSFEAEINLGSISTAYDMKKCSEYFEFGVRVWNKATRWREFRKGLFTLKPKSGAKSARLQCELKDLWIPVRDFSGEIEIEPILVTRTPTLLDTDRNIILGKGSLIAWSEPVVISLDRVRKGIDSLFEFHWISFQKPPAGVTPPEGSFFFVKWEPRPKLFLNLDIENLQPLLVSDSKSGRSHDASVRRAVNSIIAHQVLSTGLSAALQQAQAQRAEDPECSAEDLLSGLDEQNRAILRGWIVVLGGDTTKRPEEQLLDLLDLDDQEITARIAEQAPSGLQLGLGTRKAVENLISVVASSIVTKAD
jgi:hypothetical protein